MIDELDGHLCRSTGSYLLIVYTVSCNIVMCFDW